MKKAIKTLLNPLPDQPSETQWISVEKELPIVESPIWVCDINTGNVWYAFVSHETVRKDWINEWGVTHWMLQPVQSIPEPPKTK